ncbi:MAG TPA: DUF2891 domain-containing protein [Bryobacteraceae bacterium]|jgi:hypothetical protein|nr:DUF2891 domain-containing protein [Bryobacteraceae bacterium]
MTRLFILAIFLAGGLMADSDFDRTQAARFARLALDCVHKEYPNKIAHSLNSDADVQPPRLLTPAFYGCYDWHSSVHGHWLLVRLARLFPDAPFAPEARRAVAESLTPAYIAQEVKYLNADGRTAFERPYGLAWLLQLAAELREWDDPQAREWSSTLRPLEEAAIARVSGWLPKLEHPIRTGEHNNTAFSLGLMLDYSRIASNTAFRTLLEARARDYYLKDKACPLAYEPSGEDFLSPCLAEADAMRRVLPRAEFSSWFSAFLPSVDLEPTRVADVTDGKLYHLAGLNLSRAWMLRGIVSQLPAHDRRRVPFTALAGRLQQAGLDSIKSEHYEGGHWLGSFAVYLVSGRGLEEGTR